MKVKILKACGISGTHVCAGDIVDVTKEDRATLFAYGLAAEPTDEESQAAASAKKKDGK
jgi:hypothetical protein